MVHTALICYSPVPYVGIRDVGLVLRWEYFKILGFNPTAWANHYANPLHAYMSQTDRGLRQFKRTR